jgi:hypothetical protein
MRPMGGLLSIRVSSTSNCSRIRELESPFPASIGGTKGGFRTSYERMNRRHYPRRYQVSVLWSAGVRHMLISREAAA